MNTGRDSTFLGRKVMSESSQLYGRCSPWNFPDQNTGVGSCSLLQGIFPTQGSNPGLPHCRWILVPSEPPGKPKNTGVGSLSLLQWLFLTRELNQGLLHCKQILYQLSYQGGPKINLNKNNSKPIWKRLQKLTMRNKKRFE